MGYTCIESFFHPIKVEVVQYKPIMTQEGMRQALFEYIEVDYNRTRRHSGVEYLSPINFEKQYVTCQSITDQPSGSTNIRQTMEISLMTVYGDIFDHVENNKADVLVHGCNCLCNMGAGIALTIKNRYPEAYNVDLQTESGASNKLGTYTKANINRSGKSFAIVNAYTQYDWKGNGVLANYDAIRQVFRAIKKDFAGLRIVYPLIGSGLAKGNWQIIKSIIDEELKGEMHYTVKLIS